MFSDTQFWRLVWKEYRVQRPLWLAILIATPVLQAALVMFAWWMGDARVLFIPTDVAQALFAIGFVTTAIYLLGCSATMFAVEHETGSFDFQRALPSNQPRVFWAKIGFSLVSFLLLTAVLWLLTQVLFVRFTATEVSWFGAFGVLYMAELFAWSVFALLLIRHPLWAVIVAVFLQSLMMQVVLPYLATGRHGFDVVEASEDFKLLLLRLVVLVLVAVADFVAGKLWFEDRLQMWRWRSQPDMVPSYPMEGELPPYLGQRKLGWSRLLWLGWRDARWVVGAVLVWYACCLKLIPTRDQWHALKLPYLIGSFVCGLFSFGMEQWGGRFRFATERGCHPRIVWLSRHVTWLPPVVLMTLGGTWLCWRNPQAFQSDIAYRQFEWASVLIGPFVCYSAAQFAAMMCRSMVTALAIGLFLTILGILWSIAMTSWLAPICWSIGTWPVIGLFVTWLKANDWIEERRDRVARWRSVLGLGTPVCLLLFSLATYRVIQIPAVTLPPEWDDTPKVLARLTAAEKETLDVYRQALTEIERGEDQLESYEARHMWLKRKHPDWTDQQIDAEAYTSRHRDWLAEHLDVVPLLREAHRMPPVALALVEGGLPNRRNDWYPDRSAKLLLLMIQKAEQSLQANKLDQTWEEIVIAFELLRRFHLRASTASAIQTDSRVSISIYRDRPLEPQLLQTLINWGRHKEQTHDRVLIAIRRLEEILSRNEACLSTAQVELFHQQEMLKRGNYWEKSVKPETQHAVDDVVGLTFLRTLINAAFWERWRTERAMRWHASLALQRSEQLYCYLAWNFSTLNSSMFFDRDSDFARKIEAASKEERDELSVALHSRFNETHEMKVLYHSKNTLFPPDARWKIKDAVERVFHERAESFRVTMVLLALANFHRENARYPESLSELVPTYFAEVPCDPQTVKPLAYFPHGAIADVKDGENEQGIERVVICKGVPFLWKRKDNASINYSGLAVRQSLGGTFEFVSQHGSVVPLQEALAHIKFWPVENPAGDVKK